LSLFARYQHMLRKFFSSLWAYMQRCLSTRLLKLAHFLLVVFLLFILIEWQHENNLYRNIGRMSEIHASSKADTAVVQEAMTSINNIMQSRSALFQAQEQLSLKQDILQSADIHLMYGSGACGGYSMVLARTLQVLGYDVRIGQLKVIKGGWGGHIIIEYYSKLLHKWVMIDPLFTWIPRTKSGNMASVKYVAKHWQDFEGQMPEDFKRQYRYTNVRYTNWDKFGGIPKLYYKLAKLFMGKTYADTICLRMYRLSTFPLLFWSIVTGYFALFTYGFYATRRRAARLGLNH
jgi:hypothetical protein